MRCVILCTVVTVAAFPLSAAAQSRFGNTGPNGQGGFGSTPTLGGPSQARSGGGQTSTSAFSGTGSNLGTTGQGGNQSATEASGQGSRGGGGAMSGQTPRGAETIGTGPSVERSDTSGRLVGSSMAGQQATFGLNQALQGLRGFGNNFGTGNNRSGGQQNNERLQLRPTLRVGFEAPSVPPTVATERVTVLMTNIAERRPQLTGVTVLGDDSGRVVLRGSVANDDARRLAAALVRLEPGVRQVVNEITVA